MQLFGLLAPVSFLVVVAVLAFVVLGESPASLIHDVRAIIAAGRGGQ